MAAYTTIDDAGSFFNPITYTGIGGSLAVTGVGFQPDLTWIKNLDTTNAGPLTGSVRGVEIAVFSSEIDGNTTLATGLTAFGADGFTVGANAMTGSANDFISWNWKGGTTSGITTDGNTTITPSGYSFSAAAGFSILNYTGNATGGAKVAHGLGVAPKIVVTKRSNTTGYWYVHNAVKGDNSEAYWNDDQIFSASTSDGITPDSVNFALEGTSSATNGTGDTYFCLCFVDVQGFSKFGSYIGNGNADGTFVYTGFKPAFVQTKNTAVAGDWHMFDSKRPGFNSSSGGNYGLATNRSIAEVTSGGNTIDLLSNGFKCRTSDGDSNQAAKTIVYMAIAEDPFVNSEGVPTTAR